MSKSQKQYKRLSGMGFINSNRLYTGPGHVLSVTTTLFSEDYMRFYYRDIQAIIIRKTVGGKIFNLGFAILLIISCIPALSLDGGWSGFFFFMTALFLLLLLINLLRGPTCVCHVRTPIQTVRLRALNRVRKANRAMSRLRPLIEGAQGSLSEESLREINKGREARAGAKRSPGLIRHEDGAFHLLLFSLLLFNGAIIAVDIFYQNVAFSFISSLIGMAGMALLIISLVKQAGSDLYGALKALTWSIIPYVCIAAVAAYTIYLYAMITNPDISNNQWEMIKTISAMSSMDYPWLMGLSLFSLGCSLIIGIPGLLLTVRFRRECASSQAGPEHAVDDAISGEKGHE